MAEKSWWESAIDTVGGSISDVLSSASELAERWAGAGIASALGFEPASAAAETPVTSGLGVDNISPAPSATVPVWMWAVGAALVALLVLQPRGR